MELPRTRENSLIELSQLWVRLLQIFIAAKRSILNIAQSRHVRAKLREKKANEKKINHSKLPLKHISMGVFTLPNVLIIGGW